MEIVETKTGDVIVLALSGRLDAFAANDLERKLIPPIDSGQAKIVVNLEKLDYISSSGLRILLDALKKAKKQHGDVKLACLKPFIREAFDIVGFTGLFHMSDTEEAAINKFKEK